MLPQADGPESDEDERGVDAEEHDHTDPESDFFCDATGQTLRLGTHELCTPKQVFLSCRLRAVLVQARGGIAWASRTTCARRSTASCRRALRAPASSLSNASVTCTPRPVLPFPLRASKAKDAMVVWLQGSGSPSLRHGAARCRPGRQQAPISRGGRPPREGTDTSLPSLLPLEYMMNGLTL